MNSQCNKIDDYLDGHLDASSQAEFVEHLETCELCQFELEIENSLDFKFADAWESVNSPDSLRYCLESESGSKNESTRVEASELFNRSMFSTCLAVAATIILVVSVTFFHSPQNEAHELTKVQIADEDSHEIATELIQLPLATVFNNKNSASIFVPQSSSASYTILRAYPIISANSKLSETLTGEKQ